MSKKLASQMPMILRESSAHLTKVAQDNLHKSQKIAALEHELRVMKLAQRFADRQIDEELSFDQKVQKLAAFTPSRLDVIEASLELTPGGHKLGSLQEEEASSGNRTSGNSARLDLEAFITSGAAYN